MEKTPQILITNDDSIHAKGLHALISVMKHLGDVIVMAPERPMSGMSHSITSTVPLRAKCRKDEPHYKEYTCAGTPVDCVKLAQHLFFQDRKPDLVVSGINHGSNASINVIYSGTMGAVLESAISGYTAIGFSLLDHSDDADFSLSLPYIYEIAKDVLDNGLPADVCLNVNIPSGEIKGMKVCRQSEARWLDAYEQRTDPNGHDYFWLTGNFKPMDTCNEDDICALREDYISIVPVQFDFTAHNQIKILRKRFENV